MFFQTLVDALNNFELTLSLISACFIMLCVSESKVKPILICWSSVSV